MIKNIPTEEDKLRFIEQFLAGNSPNHIVFLNDYKFWIDDVNFAIREALQKSRIWRTQI